MASVPFTVPDGMGLLAKTQVTTPAVPGVDPKQASTGGALGLVILVVESKGSPKGELHVNTVLEHVDVRCCSIFAMVSASESPCAYAFTQDLWSSLQMLLLHSCKNGNTLMRLSEQRNVRWFFKPH